ncbi:conserved hypothetical protein [uncultured Desulfobacterium sp.]|uniref:Purine nucleoside phosphorylase n=1 Tax=uncultured Desulfobacterium sp. TaxID=201089 RepID=A0A445MVZ9_9BACT|nr:conserved hypothetical protein [uncultured Desulfobacterium sp.]
MSDPCWIQKEIPYIQFPGLSQEPNLAHGVFTRHGGVSAPPFDTLNTSYAVGDHQENVTENIRKITDVIQAQELMYMNQVHGDEIHVLRKGDRINGEAIDADAMITDIPGLALMIKQADCQGAIIYDPQKAVVANVHCGWRGNVQNILGGVVSRLNKEFGCRPSDLHAAIGPSLGPCCAEFVGYAEIFPRDFDRFMVRENHFDMWAVSCWQLTEAGIKPEHIETAGICTKCKTDWFFSYRAEGTTGRFGTVAMITP